MPIAEMAAHILGILFITVPSWHAREPPNEIGQKARKEHKYCCDRVFVSGYSCDEFAGHRGHRLPCFLYLVVCALRVWKARPSRGQMRAALAKMTHGGGQSIPPFRPRPAAVDYWRARRAATRIQGQKLCPLACAAAASVMKGPVSVERPRAACGGDIGNGAAPEHACVRRERNGQDRRIHGEAGDPN